MRKMLLLVAGFGSGFLAFLLLLANVTEAAPQVQPSAPNENVSPSPFGIQKVEYIRSADVTLPYRIPNTDLIAEKIVLYEGGYMEDNSNEEVVDIAGLELRNTGKQVITSAKVILERDGVQFTFRGSYIPADCSVLVLESSRQKCPFQNFTDCTGWQSIGDDQWLDGEKLSITPVTMGSLKITNTSDKLLKNMVLYYKNYLPYTEIYVGGITRKEKIERLAPGETAEIFPQYYARDYSRVLGVTVNNSPEIS